MRKFFLTLLLFLYMTVAALAYGPVGNGVYRGYVINENKNRYAVVEIYKEGEDIPVFQKQIPPNRPVPMPFRRWGKGFIPDPKAHQKLIEKYNEEYGGALWIQNVLLYPGVIYTIKYKFSDEENFKEAEFIFFKEDFQEGPYVIQIN